MSARAGRAGAGMKPGLSSRGSIRNPVIPRLDPKPCHPAARPEILSSRGSIRNPVIPRLDRGIQFERYPVKLRIPQLGAGMHHAGFVGSAIRPKPQYDNNMYASFPRKPARPCGYRIKPRHCNLPRGRFSGKKIAKPCCGLSVNSDHGTLACGKPARDKSRWMPGLLDFLANACLAAPVGRARGRLDRAPPDRRY